MTNTTDTIEEILLEVEEFGEWHDDTCQTHNEDECTCTMYGLKPFLEKSLNRIAEVATREAKGIHLCERCERNETENLQYCNSCVQDLDNVTRALSRK